MMSLKKKKRLVSPRFWSRTKRAIVFKQTRGINTDVAGVQKQSRGDGRTPGYFSLSPSLWLGFTARWWCGETCACWWMKGSEWIRQNEHHSVWVRGQELQHESQFNQLKAFTLKSQLITKQLFDFHTRAFVVEWIIDQMAKGKIEPSEFKPCGIVTSVDNIQLKD